MDNPEDKFCDDLQHSDKPEFQALRAMADLEAARADAEANMKQWRYELFREMMQKKGDFDL